MKWMEIDQDNLRTGIAICCQASNELCSNYFLQQRFLRFEIWKSGQICRLH